MSVMTYPAPERNKVPILQVLQRVLPASGTVLEIASGTGQHVVHFGGAMPGLVWLPSDPEQAHRASIAARVSAAGLANVLPPLALDVRMRPWPTQVADAIVCINMIHIAPWDAAVALLEEAGKLLPPEGLLCLYGPFRRNGQHTAPSNAEFDADLRRRNAQWGVRDLEEVELLARQNSLALDEVVPMPANNFVVLFHSNRQTRRY